MTINSNYAILENMATTIQQCISMH